MGVHLKTSHTSEVQFDGFRKEFDELVRILKACPLGQTYKLELHDIARKLAGMVTDHAADQKKLVKLFIAWKQQQDCLQRGEDISAKLSVEERMKWAVEALNEVVKTSPEYPSLPAAERDRLFTICWKALLTCAGEEAFAKLPELTKADVNNFLWHGCMMHKDLNATRGGDQRMKLAWAKHSLEPRPIPLKNKWENAASASKASEETRKPAEERHACGGTKLTCLCGALFNHKDDDKGLHAPIQDWLETEFGYSHVFPNTSNTRYCSHCEAAIELLVNRHLYLRFLSELFHAKTKSGFTNMEQNIFDGLQDWSTLTELAVLALYAQLISKPYIAYVRGYEGNSLDLGPFHQQLKAHIRTMEGSRGNNSAGMQPHWPLCTIHVSGMNVQCGSSALTSLHYSPCRTSHDDELP
jgi:hypothetical protein